MKYILICVLLVFSLPMIAQASDDLSCYTHEYTQRLSTGNSNILLETQTQDFIAIQGEHILSPLDVGGLYKNIPFKSSLSGKSLDTQDSTTIELTIDELSTNNYEIHFQHDAQYHTPKYYISEDGETYSLVTARNISDFRIYKVKIVFVSTRAEEIREIINIKNLSIERKNYISSLKLASQDNIHFYLHNSCNKRRIQLPKSNQRIDNVPIYDILTAQSNGLYLKRVTDTDMDGVKDLYDNCISVKNRDQKDINQNKVGDACEFDSDKDGVPDEIDNCRNTANPGQKDSDKDRIGNSCDNCQLYNPSQKDEDGNKIGDTCDEQKIYLLNNDSDTDGVINSQDNCRDIPNSDQADSDNDGRGNVCDNCKLFQNANQSDLNENGIGDICEDSDNDGIDSITDNCPDIANQDQADSDNDGIGNVCEDEDNDRVVFSLDNCPYDRNSDQLDTDDDGLGDVCDDDDNRFLESNKPLFILLMFMIIAGFVAAIFTMARKLQK